MLCRPFELTRAQFAAISRTVRDCAGINLRRGKEGLVRARLSKRLRALGVESFAGYLRRLESDEGAELVNMLDAISTNHTRFFREPAHFQHLAERLLPEIAAGPQRRLRIWSAGCSSGEEPYSIAMTLREALRDVDAWDVGILATDLSSRALREARAAVYASRRVADVPYPLRARYFTRKRAPDGPLYHVGEAVRGMVRFARLNLIDPWPMRGPLDAIFCRNVMIYFDKPTQQRLVDRFWKLLAPGGVLFVGHAESLIGVQHRFRYLRPTVYRKP